MRSKLIRVDCVETSSQSAVARHLLSISPKAPVEVIVFASSAPSPPMRRDRTALPDATSEIVERQGAVRALERPEL